MTKQTDDASTITRLNDPIYHRWQALYLSFYSLRLLIDVIKRWRGFGLLYLLLAVTVFSIPLSVRLMLDFNHFFDSKVIKVIQKVPSFMIQNGKVIFDQPMPFKIKNDQDEVVAMIDTRDEAAFNEVMYPQLSLLITKNKMFYRAPSYAFFSEDLKPSFGSIYEETLSPDLNEVFQGTDFVKFSKVNTLKKVAIAVIYPVVIAVFFVMLAGFLLLLSIVGQFVAKLLLRSPLSFAASCRLIAVSATPAMAFIFIRLLFKADFPGSGMIFLSLIVIYFCLGAIAYRREQQFLARVN